MCKVNKESLMKTCMATAVICALALPAFAATTNNGCDNESNDRINPEIALCSTHVYNIGQDQNRPSESDKQLMRNVVALKTTVMTQQMYKQYEYLETMIRRFKTQLEKAVLTTKLQAAGADTSAAGGSSYSGVGTSSTANYNRDSYVVVDGARDCQRESGTLAVLQCVQNNINIALGVLDGGNNGDAKKQLLKDFEIAQRYGKQYNKDLNENKPDSCKRLSYSGTNASSIKTCAYDLLQATTYAIDEYNKLYRTVAKQ